MTKVEKRRIAKLVEHRIRFNIGGSAEQLVVVVKKGLTIHDLVRGLNDGIYATSLSSDDKVVIDSKTLGTVAHIHDQSTDDGEYTEFEQVKP
jgi:hypothetical protein